MTQHHKHHSQESLHRGGWEPACSVTPPTPTSVRDDGTSKSPLSAKKAKKRQGFGGGGFGKAAADAAPKSPRPVPADKQSLEKQWDIFAGITDLEITPKGSPGDEDYTHFI
ncbi:hypothetical protein THAOC_17968, partial [Thalassiosira oceanica]